jgi:endo-1,3-1,4-beta-glycanase ExoK
MGQGDHQLGRSYLDPANVGVGAGNLRIKLPARSLEGGEIRSNAPYGYGTYSARMRLPHAPSSITGFFLYEPPDYASEIDIEVYNASSRRMAFYSTYAGGAQTRTEEKSLPFDPTDGFHEYRLEYGPGAVRFYADGRLMKEWTDGLPASPMRLYVNAWYPAWLEGRKPNKDKYLLVDSIRHTGS